MAFEQVVLDPDEVAIGRSELDITPWISLDGVDWGTAEIAAYMADQARGSTPVDYRVPNRTIGIPLTLKDIAGGLTFAEVRSAVQSKVARFQAEGGWLKRVPTDSDAAVYLDIVNASLVIGGDWLQAHRDVDTRAVLALEAIPEFYGDEVTLSDHVETTAAELIFTETGIDGDYPGRVRIVVDDDSGNDQRGLLWSVRSRHYSSANTALVAYEAESLKMLDTATSVAKAGASNGTVVTHGTLSTNWTPVIGTNIPILSNAWMTHTGTNRIFARVHSTAGTTVQTRFVWDVGDFVYPVENRAVRLYHTAGSLTDPTGYQILDLGEVRLDQVASGTHRWQGQIQAKGDVGNESFSVDRLWVVNTDDGFGVLRAPFTIASNLGTYSARSDFLTESGAIGTGNDALSVGGTWVSTSGTAGDYSVATLITGIKVAQRTAISDPDLNSGRYATASTPTLTDTAVQAKFVTTQGDISATGDARYGVLARYVDTSNWLFYGVAITDNSAVVSVIKRVAGTVTTIAAGGSSQRPGAADDPTGVGGVLSTNLTFGLRLVVSSGGYWTGSIALGYYNNTYIDIMGGYDSVLATGGVLASGKVGFYDAHVSTTAASRDYFSFAAWAPPRDAVAFGSQSVELGTGGLIREDQTGAVYGPVSYTVGDLPRIPPAGGENRTAEFCIKLSRGDLETIPDASIDDLSARVFYRPCWLFVGES